MFKKKATGFIGLIPRPNESSDDSKPHEQNYQGMDDVEESRMTDSAKPKYKDKRNKNRGPARDSDGFNYTKKVIKDLNNG